MIDLNTLFDSNDRVLIGNMFVGLGEDRYDKAMKCFGAAIESDLDNVSALCNAAYLAMKQKHFIQSQVWSDRAMLLAPTNPHVLGICAVVAQESGDYERARELFEKSIQIDPKDGTRLLNYAYMLQLTGDYREALRIYTLAKDANVMDFSARFQRSMCMMTIASTLEEWKQALDEYEIRQLLFKVESPKGIPIYTGVERATVLVVCAEQGLGDCVMMARYARYLKQNVTCEKVYFYCKEPWVQLMSRVDGFDGIISHGSDVPVGSNTYYIPAFSLLRLTQYPQQQPSHNPYLKRFRDTLEEIRFNWKSRVGLCWSGNPIHGNDKYRSIGPDLFRDTFADMAEEVDFYALQQDCDNRFRPDFAIDCHITTPEKLAHVIDEMDMIITVDTAVGHIAGAMGIPCLILLPSNPDWRWSAIGPNTDWYPSVQLLRAQKPMEWTPVLKRAKAILASRIQL